MVLQDNIGMFYHNYDLLLSSVLASMVSDFNATHAKGINLTTGHQLFASLAAVMSPFVISPFVVD